MIDIHDHIAALNLDPSLHYHVACSGGVDSMVLLSVLQSAGLKTSAIHMNYGLRGAESDMDAELIQTFCRNNDIPCLIKNTPLAERIRSGGNVQIEARNERYNWFRSILEESPSNRVALAHHKNDQIETFYLNLARGAGVMGLCAMPFEHEGILRPLLSFSKEELISFAQQNALSWREDRTNTENKYTRNKLRNIILPELTTMIPSLEESVLIIIQKMQELQRDLEQRTAALKSFALYKHFLDFEQLNELNELEMIELFRGIGIKYNELQEILKIKQTGGHVRVSSSHFDLVVKERNGFSFVRFKDLTQIPGLIIEKVASLPEIYTKNEVYLDADKIEGELRLRPWEIGDRIKPVGLDGSKLISKVIKEGKLCFSEKLQTVLLIDDVNILWCPGLSVGRTALATNNSTNILKVSVNPPRSPE